MTAVATPSQSRATAFTSWWRGYWFEPMPVARLDWVARVVLVTVAFVLVLPDHWVADHTSVPGSWYSPVLLGRLVNLGAPDSTALALVRIITLLACAVGLTRRAPRLTSAVVLVGFTTWLLWAFSYGKVDHDRLTIVVALFVLAITPRVGRAVKQHTGWAIRVVQVVFALSYPLSAISKIRRGGWDWANSAVFTRAIVRRGSDLGDLLLEAPWLLRIGQWAFISFELFAIVLLVRNRRLRAIALVGVLGLHLFTFATIGISFLPHTVCIVAFFPMERLSRRWRQSEAAVSVGTPERTS
jgi:hypothetical protein